MREDRLTYEEQNIRTLEEFSVKEKNGQVERKFSKVGRRFAALVFCIFITREQEIDEYQTMLSGIANGDINIKCRRNIKCILRNCILFN